jgi:hypothetical protein
MKILRWGALLGVLLLSGPAIPVGPVCAAEECGGVCHTNLDCAQGCTCSQDMDEESTGACVAAVDPPL